MRLSSGSIRSSFRSLLNLHYSTGFSLSPSTNVGQSSPCPIWSKSKATPITKIGRYTYGTLSMETRVAHLSPTRGNSSVGPAFSSSANLNSPGELSIAEERMNDFGIVLPPAPPAAAKYIPVQACVNLLYLAGHLPIKMDGTLITGKIGKGANDIDHGYAAARQVGLNLIATLKEELGDLDRVQKVVKLFGIVQSTEDFNEQHLCMNGVSDVLVEVFGDQGVHARSAIGTNTLPLDVSVEVEAIVQICPS